MRKIYVTAAEMLELRKQGLSNHDIAKSLDISYPTVLKYIGKQDGKMEGLEAFKDAKPLKEEQEEAVKPMIPKYEPKPIVEKYVVGDACVVLDGSSRIVTIGSEYGESTFAYDSVPDLVQFLAWAMRTRMEVTADGEEDKQQAEGRTV